MCVKFYSHNSKTVNIVNKNIIRIFVNQTHGKMHFQQVSNAYISTFMDLILKGLLFNDNFREQNNISLEVSEQYNIAKAC